MAHADFTVGQATGRSTSDILTAPFRAVFRGLIRLAERDHRMVAIDRLQRASDAELAARGTTRDREVQRIFAATGGI